jgi:hypothetical protein
MANLIITKAEVETANVRREMRQAARAKAQQGHGYMTHDDLYAMAASFGADTIKMIRAGEFATDLIRLYARIAFHAADSALDAHANSIATR